MRIRENKIKKIISALPRKVLWLILILMIIYNVINTVYGVFNKKLDLRIGKATMYTTEDKTMIPTIKTNDLIITKKCQPDDLNLQDIIIFDENGITKIQRITKIQGHGENSYYTTKGDNNYHNNNVIIEYNQIKGKFEKRIPLLGLIVKMLQSKITTVFVIIILVLLFVFNMRYSDFVNMKPENIVEMHQETWLIYKSIKTGTEVRLPLYLLFNGKGIQILNKYQANLQDFFHLRDNSNVNKELIIITRLAGLSKKVSFHTARHTNATLLIYNGVNITIVQKLLGHKSVKTTQIYTNVMDMTIISDLEKNHSLAHRKKGK